MDRTSTFRRYLVAAASAIAVAVAAAPQAGAKDDELSPEDQAKFDRLKAFLETVETFVPTVNLIDAASLPVTFPFREVLEHVVVDVDFGNGEALPFMLDTGAPTYVTAAIAESYGGDVVVEQGAIAGGGAIVWSPLQLFPSVTVGNSLPIANATAAVGWEPGSSLYCVTPHGLVGAPAMGHAVWQIDYGEGEVTVAASVDQLDHIEGAIELPFAVKPKGLSPTPMVELGVGNGALTFIVDTGGGIPLTINTEDLAKVGITVPDDAPTAASLAGGAAGAFESRLTALKLPVKIGDSEIVTSVFVGEGMAPTTAGNMGHTFLKNFVVTFDWTQSKMYLDPLAADGSVELLEDSPAAAIGLHDGNIIVTSLALGGPADKAGLRIGDVVSSVDGKSVEGISADAYCDIAQSKPRSITLQSGQTFDIGKIEGFFSGGK